MNRLQTTVAVLIALAAIAVAIPLGWMLMNPDVASMAPEATSSSGIANQDLAVGEFDDVEIIRAPYLTELPAEFEHTAQVPEPTGLGLLALGGMLAAMGAARWRLG